MAAQIPCLDPTLPATATPVRAAASPEILAGRYRVLARLGAGGMGEVWEAEDLRLPRRVAIKILHEHVSDPNAAARLTREAEILAQVDHPNIVGVFDVGVWDGGRPFIVMERLRGHPLSEVLESDGPVFWPQAVALAVQMCEGLARAHALGIIHRDLKPSNVVLVHDTHGRATAKLIDFGLAKAEVVVDHARVPTRSGQVFGTPAYMAPEQVRGESVDARADVYAFGVLLFEMLAGHRPWVHQSAVEMLHAHLHDPPPPLCDLVPNLPEALGAIVARCLAKPRDARYPDVHVLRADLLGVAVLGGTVALSPTAAPIASRPAAARRRAGWIAGGLVAGLAAASAVWVLGDPPDASTPAAAAPAAAAPAAAAPTPASPPRTSSTPTETRVVPEQRPSQNRRRRGRDH